MEKSKKKNTKWIWNTFWMLLIATAIEVGISFTPLSKELLKIIFIGLTLVKAYYIVALFMHLKFEFKSLQVTVLVPCIIFLVYLIAIFLFEGSSLNILGVAVE